MTDALLDRPKRWRAPSTNPAKSATVTRPPTISHPLGRLHITPLYLSRVERLDVLWIARERARIVQRDAPVVGILD
jgi:hypothetical protein